MSDADDERELAAYEELEGAFVTLKLVGPNRKLASLFESNADMRDIIGVVEHIPDLERLQFLMDEDETMMAWEVARNNKHIGYCFFILFDGPPFVAVYLFDGANLEFGKDCMELLVPVFFQNTDEEALFYYLPRPVPDEIHEHLVEAGFDPWDENPTIDNDEVATYILERYTFDAYYGAGHEEFEGDFDGESDQGLDEDNYGSDD